VNLELSIVLAVLAAMLALFVSNRLRLDLVALMGLLVLVLDRRAVNQRCPGRLC
jgi:hypothetical protein